MTLFDRLKRLIPSYRLITFIGLLFCVAPSTADICIDSGGCRLPSGECGVDVGSGCVSFEVGSCIQAGGCILPSGDCGVDVGSGCVTFREGACYQTGCKVVDGNCVCEDLGPDSCEQGGGTPVNGCKIYSVPEPDTLVLLIVGLIITFGFQVMRTR
jgi:hypothetical protein